MIRRRLWRISQKPPYAYVVCGVLVVLAMSVAMIDSIITGGTGLVLLMAGYWFGERGATHSRRLDEHKRIIRELTDN